MQFPVGSLVRYLTWTSELVNAHHSKWKVLDHHFRWLPGLHDVVHLVGSAPFQRLHFRIKTFKNFVFFSIFLMSHKQISTCDDPDVNIQIPFVTFQIAVVKLHLMGELFDLKNSILSYNKTDSKQLQLQTLASRYLPYGAFFRPVQS